MNLRQRNGNLQLETFNGWKTITDCTDSAGSPQYAVYTGEGMSRRSWYCTKDEYERAKTLFERVN